MGFSSHWNPITQKVSFTISQRADQCRVEMERDNRKKRAERRTFRVFFFFSNDSCSLYFHVSFCMIRPIFLAKVHFFFTDLVMLASLLVPYEYLKCFCLNLFSNMHIQYPFQFSQDSERQSVLIIANSLSKSHPKQTMFCRAEVSQKPILFV